MSDMCASFSLCSSIILIFALHTNIFTVSHCKQYILVQLSIIQTYYTYLLYLSRYQYQFSMTDLTLDREILQYQGGLEENSLINILETC